MTRPLCIDLFCGLGGWAEGFLSEGYRVVGFDNDPRFATVYPGEFVLADVRSIHVKDGWWIYLCNDSGDEESRFLDPRCIVASPPCTEYAPWSMPESWHRRRVPDSSCVDAVWRIRRDSGVPTILENVRGAVRWLGKPTARRGAQYLWGDVPILQDGLSSGKGKWRLGPSKMRTALRAKIPLPLARAVARGFL